ncbi:unnamed protein product [Sympodiomycopsis kandeliae]
MASRIILHYDVVSPWSYVAFSQLTKYAKVWDIELQLVPINLGYVMKTSGNKPPITVANKGKWMWTDMRRAEKFYGVKLNQPKDFPFNSMPLQCALRTLKHSHPELLSSATTYFYKLVWESSKDTGLTVLTPEGITKEFQNWNQLNSSDLTKVLETAFSKDARKTLNDEAIKLVEDGGAFGAPWIVTERNVNGKKETCNWFGSDRTEQIAAWLGKPYKGPLADGTVSASKL